MKRILINKRNGNLKEIMSFNLNTSLETFIDVMKKVLYPNVKRKLIDSYDCSRYDPNSQKGIFASKRRKMTTKTPLKIRSQPIIDLQESPVTGKGSFEFGSKNYSLPNRNSYHVKKGRNKLGLSWAKLSLIRVWFWPGQ